MAARLQVLAYLDSLEELSNSMVTLLEPEGISAVVKQQLKAMMAECNPGRSTGKQDAVAAHMHVLLGMLRLAMCTSAAHDAAELVVDLYPVVGRTLGVELPAVDDAGKGGTSEGMEGEHDAAGQGTGWVNQLTECLLSLLSDSLGSVPMAVMRVASEGVWRSAAPHVNAVALSDLLQVLLRLDQKAVAEEAMFEEEEEEEEDEDEEEDDDEDDDEDDEEDDEEEEEAESEEELNDGGAAKGGPEKAGSKASSVQAKGGGAGEESEDEDEGSEDEGLDDAAMFRLDKQLGKYFATLKGGKEVRLSPLLSWFAFAPHGSSLVALGCVLHTC